MMTPRAKAALTSLATWAASKLISYALQRAFGGKQGIVYAQIDRQLSDVRSPEGVTGVIDGAIEAATGRPATTLENQIVRLAYDPLAAALAGASRRVF